MVLPCFPDPTYTKHYHHPPLFLVSTFLILPACYTQSIPIPLSVGLYTTVSDPPFTAAPAPAWVIDPSGMEFSLVGNACFQECLTGCLSPQRSMCLFIYLFTSPTLAARVPCAALAAFGVWEGVYMCLSASWNWAVHGLLLRSPLQPLPPNLAH